MRPSLPKYTRLAKTQNDVDHAQRLRFQSIAADLRIAVATDPRVGREISSVDNLETTYHLLLCCGRDLVGTARLALPNREIASVTGQPFGFELEEEFDLSSLSAIPRLAEVARVCILRAWRSTSAVLRLYEGLYCLSRELGVTHWIGGVDCQTSRADEAELMRSVLEHRNLIDPRFCVEAHPSPAENLGSGAFYSDHERAHAKERPVSLRIASTLTTFTRRLGARCIGRPARHPAFPRCVMPMLAALDELPESTLAKFDLSTLAPAPGRLLSASSVLPANDVGTERKAS
jgi:L-ornithine Nalpha-acyltransferase